MKRSLKERMVDLKARATLKRAAVAVALLIFVAAPALLLHQGAAASTVSQYSDEVEVALPVELLSLRYGWNRSACSTKRSKQELCRRC